MAYLWPLIKRNFCFCPHFLQVQVEVWRLFMHTEGFFLSDCMHTFVKFLVKVSEHVSFLKIIHPPDRRDISRCWLTAWLADSLRLLTIKNTLKCTSKDNHLSLKYAPKMSCRYSCFGHKYCKQQGCDHGSQNQSIPGISANIGQIPYTTLLLLFCEALIQLYSYTVYINI